jgi:hypothetical protein
VVEVSWVRVRVRIAGLSNRESHTHIHTYKYGNFDSKYVLYHINNLKQFIQ